ncbi:MAG TPA: CotH kinase family protein [Polyangiaceae bacterium]|nr:CotH kinase family protein [Polyangiaceae bacterium]
MLSLACGGSKPTDYSSSGGTGQQSGGNGGAGSWAGSNAGGRSTSTGASGESGQAMGGATFGGASSSTNGGQEHSGGAGASSSTAEGGHSEPGGAGGEPTTTGGATSQAGAPGHDDPDVEPSGPVPVLWLTIPGVPNPDDIDGDEATGFMRVIEAHDGTHADPAGFATAPASLETPISIHVRGKSSQGFAKKNYALEFHQQNGDQVKLKFLGMPKESDWVLHGPYPDKTLMRNALVYWIAREMYRLPDGKIEAGRWSPRTRFTELYMNGQYWGVYVAIERIKADADRVDVDRPAADAQSGDVSGGYIIRREGGGDGENNDWVSRVDQLVYTHHYPKPKDLSPAQTEFIRGYFDSFESMMLEDYWNDPSRGYPAWLDVTSTLDYFLAMEWTNNVDGYFKSVYMVKHAQSQGGRLSFGPLWDFDIALGNADYRNGDKVTNWVHNTTGTEASPYKPPGEVTFIPPYVRRLWGDEGFRLALRCRWEALRAGALSHDPIEAKLDAWAARLSDAERRDHMRWPVIGKRIWPNPVAWISYEAEIVYLKRFMRQRFEFLDVELAKLGPGECL